MAHEGEESLPQNQQIEWKKSETGSRKQVEVGIMQPLGIQNEAGIKNALFQRSPPSLPNHFRRGDVE